MSSLYPARRIPQWMILIGITLVAISFAMGAGHFVFGVPVNDRNTGEPASDLTIAILLFAFAGVGILFVLVGRVVLRAAIRHRQEQMDHWEGS